jgi:SNF family Na+-dependent transporter
MAKTKERWATRLGVILAVSGSAVGIGNFLRFPGNVAENGGGAFMIPYFCALLFLAIPICVVEWAIGKYAGQRGFYSYPSIFGVVGRRQVWGYLGVVGLVVPVVVFMYYILLEAWCLGYAWCYLVGGVDLGSDPSKYAEASDHFFINFVGQGQDGGVFQGGLSVSVVFWIVVFLMNFAVIYRGISKGIEAFCNVAMPLMTVLGVVVLIRVLTLGTPNPEFPERNVLSGLGFMWNPKPMTAGGSALGALANPQVWLAAAGQIFFTLSIGFGVIANYASYLKKEDDIVLSGLTASATNEVSEVCLGGLITIPAAFVFMGAVGLTQSLGSTFDLGFRTLPVVFMYMPGGRFFGFVWFFMLFLAAICSSLSMLQPAIAFLEESLSIGRRASCTLLGLVTITGSLFVAYFSKDLVALSTIDFWVGSVLVFILSTIEVILFAWVFGAERGREYANIGASIKLPRLFTFAIKYVTPAYLLIVFTLWAVYNLPGELRHIMQGGVRLVTILIIAAVTGFFLLLIHQGRRHWVSFIAAPEVTGSWEGQAVRPANPGETERPT